ncbi:DUF2207 domain-containing protein [Membranihabitans marinus]|uniref:DUF2207 domain-containing protein n=1 Tax=Membranihabitans marinus TaxID=1227546 RepID=UPI0021D46A22|nr:DUF2207 domain-containing protein [Membranihabitans marinus]
MRYLIFYILIGLSWQLTAQEEILSYDVDILIGTKNNIEVTEKITIRSEGNEIRRGIYRNFPISRPNANNVSEPTPIRIQSIKKDGKSEPFHTEKNGQELKVYIGDKDVLLDPGVYTYEISYKSENQISFFEEYDELYWNVIGHFWLFPINQYSATIHLPSGATFLQGSCYTGSAGSTDDQCSLTTGSDNSTVILKSKQGLTPFEGATFAVAWPKGFVTDEFKTQSVFSSLNIGLFILSLALFSLFAYRWWQKVGQDPAERAIVPRWDPPADLSPSAMNYILNHHINNDSISATLVSAAVKGSIKIENHKKKFTFTKVSDDIELFPEEAAFVDRLFIRSQVYTLKKGNYSRYQSALSNFQSTLKSQNPLKDYYRYNWKYIIIACLLLAIMVSICFSFQTNLMVKNRLFAFFFTFLFAFIAYIITSIPYLIRKWYKWLIILPMTLIVVVVFTGFVTSVPYHITNSMTVGILFGISSIVLGVYQLLIVAPTEKGQKTTAEIKGFKLYLEKSEKALLEFFTPPEQTPELFEKYLPYAIALGVENKWAKKFKDVLAKAIENNTYHPVWYSGNINQIHNISSQFSSAVSTAAPKSSSGSGGGGFSGGGGGGGGGGGW